jgi:hypothetical protein
MNGVSKRSAKRYLLRVHELMREAMQETPGSDPHWSTLASLHLAVARTIDKLRDAKQ